MSHSRRTARSVVLRALVAGAAGVACVASGVGPASAEVYEHISFEDHFAFTDDDYCGEGVTIDVEGTALGSGLAMVRGDGILYGGVHVLVDAVHTNADSGDFVRIVERTFEKDLKVEDNGDGTITITVLATGNATLYDSDGRAIARNPGQVRFQILIDHGGTLADPSDDEFVEFLGITRESTGRNDDFCTATLADIG